MSKSISASRKLSKLSARQCWTDCCGLNPLVSTLQKRGGHCGSVWRDIWKSKPGGAACKLGKPIIVSNCLHGHKCQPPGSGAISARLGIDAGTSFDKGWIECLMRKIGGLVLQRAWPDVPYACCDCNQWISSRETRKLIASPFPWLYGRFIDPMAIFHFCRGGVWVVDIGEELGSDPFDWKWRRPNSHHGEEWRFSACVDTLL